METKFASLPSITTALLTATGKDESVPRGLQEFITQRLNALNVIPLEDDELPEELRPIAANFRKIPTIGAGYYGPVARLIRGGCELPEDNQQYGWDSLKEATTLTDERTTSAIAFWVPRLVEGSTYESPEKQIALLRRIRREVGLPSGFLSSFGSATLLRQLMVAHEDLTGEGVDHSFVARTDTFNKKGWRIHLHLGSRGFGDNQLCMSDQLKYYGTFALGLVDLTD